MSRKHLTQIVLLLLIATASTALDANPCVGEYPKIAGEILTSDGGRIARIEPIEWLEDGVYKITLESGGVIMARPGRLAMPQIGSKLELRVFSKTHETLPFAGCYCQAGTEVCIEEYTFP